MKLTTALGALALAGAIASGAMAQAPREVSAQGHAEAEYRATYAHASFMMRVTEATTLPELEPRIDAFINETAPDALVKTGILPILDEEHTNWLERIFIDWDDEERYSKAFLINIEGPVEDLLAFERALSSTGEIYRRNFHNFRLPVDTDFHIQAVREAETVSRANAELIANAFGCGVGDLIHVQFGFISDSADAGFTILTRNSHPQNRHDPFETKVEVTLTAKYETVCPAED